MSGCHISNDVLKFSSRHFTRATSFCAFFFFLIWVDVMFQVDNQHHFHTAEKSIQHKHAVTQLGLIWEELLIIKWLPATFFLSLMRFEFKHFSMLQLFNGVLSDKQCTAGYRWATANQNTPHLKSYFSCWSDSFPTMLCWSSQFFRHEAH